MSKYGIPYKGNKSKIAEDILEQLPSGNRLVDLFGGGFAITDCALRMFPCKWNKFYYNDINSLLPELIRKAINGEYDLDRFKPVWISRERFYKEKELDGYIKWIWSFGNNWNDYLYGKSVEEDKHKIFEFIVNGVESDITEGIELFETDVNARRLEWIRKSKGKREISLERLSGLSQLESLTRLDSLSRLESLTSFDYREYEYQDGDVVYCDIPYEDATNKKDYGGGFNHEDFFKWASSQDYPVYYSSYSKGKIIWQKEVRSVMNSASGSVRRNEVLYCI